MAGPQTATLMRIFLDETDRHGKRPLFMAIVEELRRNGFAGATVLKGIEGYGVHGEVHALRTFDLSTNLPILIEVAEADEKVQSIIPRLREIIPEGLITVEKIRMKRVGRFEPQDGGSPA
jgi:PII-like signaling protein